MTKQDKLLLEVYKAIGMFDEIIKKFDKPYFDVDEGYVPLLLSDYEKVRAMLNVYPAKPDSGLLEDDGMGVCPFEDDSCTISINDWEA